LKFVSRASIEKQISLPQAAGLSLKLHEKWQIQDAALADLAFLVEGSSTLWSEGV